MTARDVKEFVITGLILLVISGISVLVIYLSDRSRLSDPSTRTCTYRETGAALIIECPVPKP